jgi:hypothetical protein
MTEVVAKEKKDKYDEWEIRNAVDTLIRAEEIKANKKLVALAQKELDKRKKAINSIDDLRAIAKDKLNQDSE